jgi:hypothetical protein
MDQQEALSYNPLTLVFRDAAVEAEYLALVATRRWPVLVFIFSFDCACYLFRISAKAAECVLGQGAEPLARCYLARAAEVGPQLANMGLLYGLLGLLNRRSRRFGGRAARQVRQVLRQVLQHELVRGLRHSRSRHERKTPTAPCQPRRRSAECTALSRAPAAAATRPLPAPPCHVLLCRRSCC